MIKFMVIALPRSGTTWASNWLNTEATKCLHDPSTHIYYKTWDSLVSKKELGISDTAIFHFTAWLNQHPAKKVILHKPLNKINESLAKCPLPPLNEDCAKKLELIDGLHVDWQDLFNNPRPIWEHLIGSEFDEERHAELKEMNVQNIFSRVVHDPKVMTKMVRDLWEF